MENIQHRKSFLGDLDSAFQSLLDVSPSLTFQSTLQDHQAIEIRLENSQDMKQIRKEAEINLLQANVDKLGQCVRESAKIQDDMRKIICKLNGKVAKLETRLKQKQEAPLIIDLSSELSKYKAENFQLKQQIIEYENHEDYPASNGESTRDVLIAFVLCALAVKCLILAIIISL